SPNNSHLASGSLAGVESGEDLEPFVIGSKAFTEQYILLKAMCEQLDQQGVPYETRDGMGSGMVFTAMANGKIDCYIDYTGTIWTNYMKQSESSTPAEMLIDVSTFLKEEKQIICLGTLGFRNDYVFTMRRKHAEQLGIETLDDLIPHASDLVTAADIEFFDRPEWSEVQRLYGLKFKKNISMDAALMYGAVAKQEADIAIAFRTDARIDGYDLQVIEDTRFAMPPYDAVILVSSRMARNQKAMNALRPLVNQISTERMRNINGLVDVEGQSPSSAAKQLFD
ncbi:glycine betaine ABC transporter substrate-binding protein, partial [Planctomycetota bacterium]